MKKHTILILLLAATFIMISEFVEAGSFSIGAMGGIATSAASPGIEGENTTYDDTEFQTGFVQGASFLYRGESGGSIEFCIENFAMDLEENEKDIGTLKMTPIMILLKYQGMPKKGETGFTGHADIGGGIVFTEFEKGRALIDIENKNGSQGDITTENNFVFVLGAGIDYFFTRNFSANIDGRLLAGDVKTKWADGRVDADRFRATNFQILVGVRYWFR